MSREPQAPVYGIKGHLVPDAERVHQKAIEAERQHIMTLGEGESFCVKYIMGKSGLRAVIEPKRIEIA